MNKNETFFIYLTQKTFHKYFFKQSNKINKSNLENHFKEGELFKIPVQKKLYLILEATAEKHKITLDEAFLKLLNISELFQREQANLKLSSKLYQNASKCKNDGYFEKAITLFNNCIELCNDKSYMNKIQGGALFHLGLIAYIHNKYINAENFFTQSIKLYPDHKKSALYLKKIKEKNTDS